MTLCFLERAGCAGRGKGILCSEEKTFTLSTVDNMRICKMEEISTFDMKQHHNPQPSNTFQLTTGNCSTIRGDSPLVLMDQGGGVMNVEYNKTGTLRRETHGHEPIIQHNTVVRRLTPVECERLQGFPDNFTNIPWGNKDTAPDSRRYKALGNSMAVPVMRWIGKRILESRPVVYNEEAIRNAMIKPLSQEEMDMGQQSLF